jgi:hypothetical protein
MVPDAPEISCQTRPAGPLVALEKAIQSSMRVSKREKRREGRPRTGTKDMPRLLRKGEEEVAARGLGKPR